MSERGKLSIVIADDHPIFLRGLVDLLEKEGRCETVGKFTNGLEALECIRTLNPEIAVLDIVMPGMSGLDVIFELKKERISTKFILMTVYKLSEYLSKAIDLGVMGFLFKESAEEELLSCMEAVGKNQNFLSAGLENNFFREADTEETPVVKHWLLGLLTPAEIDVLKYTASYKTSKEAGGILKISSRTVENHRANICRKLRLKGRSALIKFVTENKSILKTLNDS